MHVLQRHVSTGRLSAACVVPLCQSRACSVQAMSDGAGHQVGHLHGLNTREPLPAPTANHACRRAYELAFANAYMFAGERQNAPFGFPGGRSPAGGCRECLASDSSAVSWLCRCHTFSFFVVAPSQPDTAQGLPAPAGTRPIFHSVDEVSFVKPVDVGDLLRFRSRVIHTQQPDQLPGTVSAAELATLLQRVPQRVSEFTTVFVSKTILMPLVM